MARPQRRAAFRMLTAEEEKTATAEDLILSHKPLVLKMANNFARYGMDRDDLIQEGQLGLMIAAEKFDRDLGYRFSTYATWWIQSRMREAVIRNHSIVAHPMTRAGKANFFAKVRHTDISVSKPIGQSDQTVGDLLVSTEVAPDILVEEAIDTGVVAKHIKRAMRMLNLREREIVTARFFKEPKDGLEVLGARFGISKERVRQIEARALEKMGDDLADIKNIHDR